MTDRDVVIEEDGTVRCIYDDELHVALALDDYTVTRASHVEPASSFGWDHADGWLADMRPSGGPLLHAGVVGGVKQPFATRQAALEAEVEWLRKERGL